MKYRRAKCHAAAALVRSKYSALPQRRRHARRLGAAHLILSLALKDRDVGVSPQPTSLTVQGGSRRCLIESLSCISVLTCFTFIPSLAHAESRTARAVSRNRPSVLISIDWIPSSPFKRPNVALVIRSQHQHTEAAGSRVILDRKCQEIQN